MGLGGEYFEGDVCGMVSDTCAIVQNYLDSKKKDRKTRTPRSKKKWRRQLEKKQMQKIARMEMVKRHKGNKQRRIHQLQ
jgi:hypothetical protein